jgi:hypothetical protein
MPTLSTAHPNAHFLAGQQLDVLIFTDVGMEISTYIWGFARMAPVQAVFWGHPVTTGLPNMDYFITSDLFEPPDAQDRFTEQLVRLDALSYYFFRPDAEAQPTRHLLPSMEESIGLIRRLGMTELPSAEGGAAGSGAVGSGGTGSGTGSGGREVATSMHSSNLYLVPQSIMKFHPSFDEVLHLILVHDPLAMIGVVDAVGSPVQRHILRQRFLSSMPAGVAARIKILAKVGGCSDTR